jgi:glycosyltransferase involved in cell wall biosynthesis
MNGFFEFILVVDQLLPPKKSELLELENSFTRIIHKYSGSPGISRNYGKAHAKGEYICFWDSDDEPKKQVIYNNIKTREFDIYVFNYLIKNQDSKRQLVVNHHSKLINCFKTPAVWRMVFRNDETVVGSFGLNVCGEDQIFLLKSGILTKQVLFVEEIAYNYFIHSTNQLSRNESSASGIMNSFHECIELLRHKQFNYEMNWNIALNLFNSVLKRFRYYSRKQQLHFMLSLPKLLNLSFLKCAIKRIEMKLENYSSSVFFTLAGGLGNQLFQYSAAYNQSNQEINLVTNLFPVSRNKEGFPELADCDLPTEINYCSGFNFSRFFRKIVNSSIRISALNNCKMIVKLYSTFSSFLASSLFLLENKSLMWVKIDANLKSPRSRRRFLRTLYVGYFQYGSTSNQLVSQLRKSSLVELSDQPNLRMLIQKSVEIRPVMVHIRLGDYENEGRIGLLSKEYFTSALRALTQDKQVKDVWIFSNDGEKASSYFTEFDEINFWVVEDWGFRSADTLELMRHMEGFVISNSTFSWWGARLAYLDNSRVIYPSPWFKSLRMPKDLTPSYWKEEMALFYEI